MLDDVNIKIKTYEMSRYVYQRSPNRTHANSTRIDRFSNKRIHPPIHPRSESTEDHPVPSGGVDACDD